MKFKLSKFSREEGLCECVLEVVAFFLSEKLAMAAQGTKPERVRQKDRGAQNNTAKKAKPDGEASSSRSSSSSSSDEEEEDIFSRTSLDLSKNPMPDVQGLTKTLSQFKQLQKLDISGMATSQTNQRGLSSLEWLGEAVLKSKKADGGISFGERLTWLKMTDNPTLGNEAGAKAWSGIERLVKLTGESGDKRSFVQRQLSDSHPCCLVLPPSSAQCFVLCSHHRSSRLRSLADANTRCSDTGSQQHLQPQAPSFSSETQHARAVG